MGATPIKNDSQGQYSQSGFLIWNGQAIECLGICKGDLLNDMLYILATKLCQALEPYDLSTLTLQGVFDILDKDEAGNRTLTSVLQLLADGEIAIDARLTNLQNQVDGLSTQVLVLDLKCFKETDSFGNTLPYTQQTVFQSLINEACLNKDLVADLAGQLTNLKNLFDNLNITAYTEPVIDTCVSLNKPVSQAVKELAINYCGFKTAVGDELKIQQNISKIPTNILKEYVGFDGWTQNATNLSDFEGNAAVIITDLWNRIKNIEDNCCKVTCKDVGIGFEIIPSTDGLSISLRFTEKSGTDIPASFVDKGSILYITDKNDSTISYNVVIVQDGASGPFSLLGLDTSDVLNVSLTANVGTDTLVCQKCVSKLFSPVQGCPVCEITGTGSDGQVKIIYKVTYFDGKIPKTQYQTSTVFPGSKVYIPKDAVVIALDKTGSANIDSDCLDLSTIEDFACYGLFYSIGRAGGGSTGVLEDDDNVFAEDITIGGTLYTLHVNNIIIPSNLLSALQSSVPEGPIQFVGSDSPFSTADRVDNVIYLKTTPSIATTTLLKIIGGGFHSLYVKPEESEDCPGFTPPVIES